MNELKPEDVMRALECCLQADGAPDCYKLNCPARMKDGLCFYEIDCEFNSEEEALKNMLADALDLLREKDAEIERLTKERDDARRDCAVAEQNHYECKKELETARADSITAFVDGCVKMAIGLGGIPVVCLESIFQFAKKMKEEKDGESDL